MKRSTTVCLGEAAVEVGTLAFETQGARQAVSFVYTNTWLASPDRFALSPDLPLVSGYQFRANKDPGSSAFFSCFADVEPDGWGRMIIHRDHANQRKEAGDNRPSAGPLNDLDFLLWISDFSRVGAIRFRDEKGVFQRPPSGKRETPALIALPHLLSASKAVEENKETARDLEYLRGNGTSLGGLRPKCSILDADGSLAIGKFPSVKDTRSVVHGEVLALHLAAAAGIHAARARVIESEGTPVAIITRFDRLKGKRLMYLSARSLMEAAPAQQYTYVDIADTVRRYSSQAARDLTELWRRMIFNILINNVDDHLNNHGFLHHAHDQWTLAPAFDINPFPDKERALKTWISEDAGDAASLAQALRVAPLFGLTQGAETLVLNEVKSAISRWKTVARSIGMSAGDVDSFAPAFEHPEP
ncbi:MAG: type II toxin-antitoxin system HipA family toxin [Acidiferrobacter sp.]